MSFALRRAAVSRRGVLTTGAAATVTAGPLAAAASAAPAGGKYKPVKYGDAKLLSPGDRHLVGRFSYGITPDLAAEVRRRGGADGWFEWQLEPDQIADRRTRKLEKWWPYLAYGPDKLWNDNVSGTKGGWEVMGDYQRWVMLRRINSDRQLQEVMTQFWETHLHVPTNGDPNFPFRKKYGDVIYQHALGRFDELLEGAATHPAMLVYLDQAVSTKEHPNENLARELLEIHTVGAGDYSEPDVQAMARILTGWRVDVYESWKIFYDMENHARGTVKVLGFKAANKSRDGRQVTRDVLHYLARRPQTAQRIARRLAVKFVQDDPPQALVDRLAKVYLANDTAIKPVLRALVASTAFRSAKARKVRDPSEDVVATYRALGARVDRPHDDESAANVMLWQASSIGATPFSWPRPDGPPLDSAAWSSPSRLLSSLEFHYGMSGGWWPTKDVRHREPKERIPKWDIRFDQLVDHLSQELLHQHSTAQLLQACCEAVGVRPKEKIDKEHALVEWQMPRLLTVFLDSPDFFTR
jgi:Protein of unknown function (DUF1800)